MKRIISSLCFAGCLWTAILPIKMLDQATPIQAQTIATSDNLYYLYYGQKISLRQRDNAIAIAFNTTQGIPRGSSLSEMLQRELNYASRTDLHAIEAWKTSKGGDGKAPPFLPSIANYDKWRPVVGMRIIVSRLSSCVIDNSKSSAPNTIFCGDLFL